MNEPSEELLRKSTADNSTDRLAAVAGLGDFADSEVARDRLAELLRDQIVTVRVEAVRELLEHFGSTGLELVMDELVRSFDDPSVDYLWLMMGEIQAMVHRHLYRDAFLYAERSGSETMKEVVAQLIRMWNGMQNRPASLLNPDGTRVSEARTQ